VTPHSVPTNEIFDAYEQFVLQNPKTRIRQAMLLMIHDELETALIRDFLVNIGIFCKTEEVKVRESQIRKVQRWRTAAEESTGLPPREKKGACEAYHQALAQWRAINPRPTKEQLLSGWVPKPLRNDDPHLLETPPGHDSAKPVPFKSPVTTEENTPLDTRTDTPQATEMVGRTSASELTPEYLEKARGARILLGSAEI
jgi:hypothetical protein